MKLFILAVLTLFLWTCGTNADRSAGAGTNEQKDKAVAEVLSVDETEQSGAKTEKTPVRKQTNQPKTLREFFNLLPPKYFTLAGCEPQKDKNCNRARAEYIRNNLLIEDSKNGYWKSGCDGAQSCLEMALFRRSDATYVVHILTLDVMDEKSYFLEYKDGVWADIGAQIVPEYSAQNIYVPPRYGTTVEVFKKKYTEPDFGERGAKLYDLIWKSGKFEIKK